MAKSSTAKSRTVDNHAEARGILPTSQEYVECGPYLVPVPILTTLGDTIKEAMRNPPAGWIDWLRKYHLWDQGMSERDAFTRFYKFHKVKFLAVLEKQWYIYFKRLVTLERLFVVGDAIGGVPG